MTDAILYWNQVSLDANQADFTFELPGTTTRAPEQGGPTLSSRALAIVHLAMYDAFATVSGSLPPYLSGLPPAAGPVEHAIAGAAHTTLVALYPRQKPMFDAALTEFGAPSGAGFAFGQAVGNAILADRGPTPDVSGVGHTPSSARGRHRVDPVRSGQGFHAPRYGATERLYAATERFELDAPPSLSSLEYTRSLRQVRAKGIAPELADSILLAPFKRTPDETIMGIFWAYDGPRKIGTPPRLYNQIIREIAMKRGNTLEQNARLFALVNVAMADAGILAWREKYRWDLWRPVVGIREHDTSMGPTGSAHPTNNIDDDCDPFWRPLGAPASNSSEPNGTPDFPAYPSGHATFGAASLHITRLFYGCPVGFRGPDNLAEGIAFVSDELNGVNKDNQGVVSTRHARKFSRGLWEMIEENGFSRVFLGVHWSFDAFALDRFGRPDTSRNIGGVPLGLRIAESIWTAGKGSPKRSNVT